MISKRFLLTLGTFILIGLVAAAAIFLAKGYRFSPGKDAGEIIAGTGILSIASIPDQASVYLDGHLTSATNTNINSLPPKIYKVKVVKEGFIAWEKDVEVREGLVTDIKATLFRSLPTVYPLTYTGIVSTLISPDEQKLAYVVPGGDKRSGVWVWTMSDKSIGFTRGAEPHQIALPDPNLDYTKANLRWSPDSTQLLLSFDKQYLLLDANRLNDPARDITALVGPTLRDWDEDQRLKERTRLELVKDFALRKEASEAAFLKWSPDESKILLSKNGQDNFKVIELITSSPLRAAGASYNLPSGKSYGWLSDSEHLFFVDSSSSKSEAGATQVDGKISVIEYDGFNKAEIYAGRFNPGSVFVWPDGSRLVVVSSIPTATGSQPNLFGINLK